METQQISGFGNKNCLTRASLGWKRCGTYYKDREFYTLNDKYVRSFIRKSKHGVGCGAFNKYFESKQLDETMLTI